MIEEGDLLRCTLVALGQFQSSSSRRDQRLLTVSNRTLDQRGTPGRCHARDQVGSNPLDDASPAADRRSDPHDSDPCRSLTSDKRIVLKSGAFYDVRRFAVPE